MCGHKLMKGHITMMLGANVSEEFKLKLLCIYYLMHPRSMKT